VTRDVNQNNFNYELGSLFFFGSDKSHLDASKSKEPSIIKNTWDLWLFYWNETRKNKFHELFAHRTEKGRMKCCRLETIFFSFVLIYSFL
jgi:hypothetical protein